MTVYRLISPNLMMRGSIDEILLALTKEVEPDQYYVFDDSEDLSGLEVMSRLFALKADAAAPHSYVESVTFGRSVGGNPGDFRILRVGPDASEARLR